VENSQRLRMYAIDVTERKHIEEALQDSEKRFRHVISSISHHIYVTEFTTDGHGINRYISPNVTELTGYPYQNFLNDWRFWQTLIHPDDRELAAGQVKKFMDGQDSAVEYRITKANGATIWLRDSGRVEQSLDKQSTMAYSVVSDITEHQEAAAILAQARDQALAANQLKSQLLARASHELRTPLNAILGYADMLKEGVAGVLPDKQSQFVRRIIVNTDKLKELVNNLLGQAQIEEGELKLHMNSFNPADLLDQVKSVLGGRARSKGLQFQCHLAPNVPPVLMGDVQRLQDILINLVNNAIKFTVRILYVVK